MNIKFQAAAKGAGTSGPIKTPVKLSDEISIIPTKKGGEKKVNIIIHFSIYIIFHMDCICKYSYLVGYWREALGALDQKI